MTACARCARARSASRAAPSRYSTVEANALFIRNLKNQEFDVSEMSFSTYITLKDRGAHHYTAVPVFLSRAFRHSAIFVRTDRVAVAGRPQGQARRHAGISHHHAGVDARTLVGRIRHQAVRSALAARRHGAAVGRRRRAPEPVAGVEIENIPVGQDARRHAGRRRDRRDLLGAPAVMLPQGRAQRRPAVRRHPRGRAGLLQEERRLSAHARGRHPQFACLRSIPGWRARCSTPSSRPRRSRSPTCRSSPPSR